MFRTCVICGRREGTRFCPICHAAFCSDDTIYYETHVALLHKDWVKNPEHIRASRRARINKTREVNYTTRAG